MTKALQVAHINTHVNTIIWDLDGTLLDSFGVYADVLTAVAPKHGLSVPPMETMSANFHGSLEDSINACFGGIGEVLLADVVDDFLVVQNDYYDHINDHLFGDALELVRNLHAAGKRQVIVTNRAHAGRLKASPRYILENSELCQYVDIVLCGDDSEHRKPSPKVLDTTAIDPQKTCVIGDQYVDAEFAANIGCDAIIVDRTKSSPLQRANESAARVAKLVANLEDVTVI